MSSARPEISVVVPVYDEAESLPQLHEEITRHVGGTGRTWEVLYTDDRSRDGSYDVLQGFAEADPEHVRVLRFRRNFGQTAAMSAGFEYARGEVVVTLDADLQNDPADIPKLLAEVERGFDLVVGWRRDRKDGFLLRRVPSQVANRLIAKVTGADVHDTGCTLKAFRRDLVANLPIYAEQHRFLPVLALGSGARIAEVVVNHRPRIHGVSKYGIGRATRVLLDLLTVKMISGFSRSPLQYFALLALPFLLLAGGELVTLFLRGESISLQNRWGQGAMLTFALLVLTSVDFLLLGLLAELVIKASDLHKPRRHGPLVGEAEA